MNGTSPIGALAGIGAPDVLLGVPVHRRATTATAVAAVLELAAGPEPAQVCFVNAHCVNTAQRNPEYRAVLHRSRLNLVDGHGMTWAGRMLHLPMAEDLNGTDLFPHLLAAMARAGRSLFLLGGRPGVPEKVERYVRTISRDLIPDGCSLACGDGYFTAGRESEVVGRINASGADVLLVGMGVPRQEIWIARHLGELSVRVAMGVGGLFDFYAGCIPRAPWALRRLGLEWAYRMYREPRRLWRRYLIGNPLFVLRVLRAAVRGSGDVRHCGKDGEGCGRW